MQSALSVFLVTLGLGQIISSGRGWRAASLVGPNRRPGWGVGIVLIAIGGRGLIGPPPEGVLVLGWAVLAGPLAFTFLLVMGSLVSPPPHPDSFFKPEHPAHGGCDRVDIPDGEHFIPALLLKPPGRRQNGAAVCLVHGAGDTKHGFKWRLMGALLAQGLTVLTIDLPGHGQYRHRPLAYPDSLSTIPAAVRFLQTRPGVNRVGLLALSLGGALSLKALAVQGRAGPPLADAVAVLETPIRLRLNRALVWHEAWCALRAPVLSILGEISVWQIWKSWKKGGYQSRHTTAELFGLLNPLDSIRRMNNSIPVLLVYSQRDPIAPYSVGQTLQQAAPQAQLIKIKNASHVTLILLAEVNHQVAAWLSATLG